MTRTGNADPGVKGFIATMYYTIPLGILSLWLYYPSGQISSQNLNHSCPDHFDLLCHLYSLILQGQYPSRKRSGCYAWGGGGGLLSRKQTRTFPQS